MYMSKIGPAQGLSKEGDAFIERVRAIVPALRARADAEEKARNLSKETIKDLRDTGVIHMHVPKEFGGGDLGFWEHYEMSYLVSQGSASAGWVASFLAQCAIWIRKYSPEVQAQVFSDPDYNGCCGTNQAREGSNVRKVDGGWILNGRWGFSSGCMHSTWAVVSVPHELDGRKTRMFCLVPMREMAIDDMWFTTGLCATASNDILAKDVFIPDERVQDMETYISAEAPGVKADPNNDLSRCPIFRIAALGHPAYPLGAAHRALEIFKTDILPRRARYWGGGPLMQSETIHRIFGACYAKLRAAEMMQREVVEGTIAGLHNGFTLEDRADLTLLSATAVDWAADAVAEIVRQAGGSIHFAGEELDRINRDMLMLGNHSTGDVNYAEETCGRVLLGLGLQGRIPAFF